MKKRIIVFSLLLHLLNWAQETKSVHISEIMFYPLETNGEYIELYNSSNTAIDLSKYKIIYSTSSVDTIVEYKDGTNLPPNNFAIIFENDYDFTNGKYFSLISDTTLVLQIDNSKFGSSGMANTSDRFVYLVNSKNDTIDIHQYTANNKAGYSDEKINLMQDDDPTNWSNSLFLNGTPGTKNSVSPSTFDLSINSISFTPNNVFINSPISISLKVSNLGISEANNFVIKIFIDFNLDSLSQTNEIVYEKTTSSLPSGDSLEVLAEWSIATFGIYSICSSIEYELDENLQNNFYSKLLYVNPEPNEYNDIVINEIMFKPLNDQPEWIELFNNTDKEINLKNWRIEDKSSQPLIDDTTNVISAKGYMVLTESDEIANYFELVSNWITLNLPSLNNTGDNIKLIDSLGRVIDSVNYEQAWGGSNGYSLERISPNIESNDKSNWSSSISKNLGTPGMINSITQKRNDLEITFVQTPIPYAIIGDDFEIVFIVKNVGLNNCDNFNIKIFNDSNNDLITQEDELVKSTFYENLEIGDSLIITEFLSEFSEGQNNYIIQVSVSEDDFDENNEIQISFIAVIITEVRDDLIINEIMHSPISPEPEWIEIYNRSNKEINLNQYRIADKSDTAIVVFNNKVLLPEKYFVISDDSTIANIYTENIDFITAHLPNLNNTGDKIILLDSLNRVIDSLIYLDSWGGNAGPSLERISSEKTSTDSTNWSSCKLPQGGSPGKANTNSQKDFDIIVSEILFNPSTPNFNEHVDISAKIVNVGKENVTFQIKLFEDVKLDSSNIYLTEISGPHSLTQGDSTIINFSYSIDNIVKKHTFIVKAVMINEQDTTNNQLTKSISPSYIPSSIIVNEIMYSPINGEPEWVELLNTTEDSISISDFTISDILTTPKSSIILTNKFIAPNNYILISKDSSIVEYHTSIPVENIILNFANLNNDVDGIVIKDSFGKTIDSVQYKSMWGGTNGFSLERVLSLKSSTDSSNWKTSNDIELSTPGRKNSVTPFEFDLSVDGIKTIPPNPTQNEDVFVEIKLTNIGLQMIQGASLKIEYGLNNERQFLSATNSININVNDSVSIKSDNSLVVHDSTKLYVSVFYNLDQNTSNNFADTTIIPRAERNAVLINEFMANPNTNEAEWIELYNNSGNSIDISKWFISDLYTAIKLVEISDTPILIEPYSFLVISNDTSKIKFKCPNIVEAKFGTLGNIEDGIILCDFTHGVVDSLKYNSDWNIKKGRSLERESFESETTNISNWLPSLAQLGSTPGISNSILETSPSTINSIIINEIMFDPDESNSEFIEVYNRTNKAIDIGGWHLIINDKDYFEITSTFLELKADEYFVISSDSNILGNYSFSETNLIHILNSNSLSLSNSGESIVIIDHWNNLIDSVYYNDKWHNQNIAITKNKSLERISPIMDSNEFTNWSTSVHLKGGTPGNTNSVFTKNDNLSSGISFNPNPFSPDNDGFEDFAIINFSLPFNTAQIRIKIFDDHGRLVRNLINNKPVASSGSILFNGLDEDGNPLRIGMYIVFLEAVDLNSGKSVSFKDIIVVARKL